VQLDTVDGELRRFARTDARCQALQSIYAIGPILACHLLAETGEACRFRRACAGHWSKRPCMPTGPLERADDRQQRVDPPPGT